MARRDPTPTPEPDDWQTRLAEVMEARGVSGGELARRAGFTSQYVNSLRAGDRGARLPAETARKLAHALGVSVDWLTRGEGPRERLSDVFVVSGSVAAHAGGDGSNPGAGAGSTSTSTATYRPPSASEAYPSRAEAIALLASVVEREVIDALRAVVPEGRVDPGREWWIAYAKELARDLKRIKADPDLNRDAPPKSAYVPTAKKR